MDMHDVFVIEQGGFDVDEVEYFCAIQRAINGGHAWRFQGSYGRAMMDAIEAGRCVLGPAPARDYWGNIIPSRKQVKDGTKGSVSFVAHHNGQEWADYISRI